MTVDYIGHPLQIRGAEQVVLQGGRGDGMHFLIVRNGIGLEAWISLDRCSDLTRVTYEGKNMGYFSPCGNVASQYYDAVGDGFLKSFTAGFFTTAGLSAVGSPCTDEGETLPLHGTIANTPAELNGIEETDDSLIVSATVRDCRLFGRKLVLKRRYVFSYTENSIRVEDKTTNEADVPSPFMILYHCNMGYPLLDENSVLKIPNAGVTPRNQRALSQLESALTMEKPQTAYEECCYYYDIAVTNGLARAGIYNKGLGAGMVLSYDKKALPCFTEWKMMGKRDYTLGLEPGNCTPDGRDIVREAGKLRLLAPGETAQTAVSFSFMKTSEEFGKLLG